MALENDSVNIEIPDHLGNYRNFREMVMDWMWMKDTFMLVDSKGTDKYNKWLKANKYFSTADIKAMGTGPGFSLALNPIPQITRYADIRRPGTVKSRDTYGKGMRITGVPGYAVNSPIPEYGLGLGRYYSEAIDDNQQRIFLRFGEPQYMSMLLWLGKSFDIHKAILLKRGIITRLLAQVVGIMAGWFAFRANPIMYLGALILNNVLQPDRFISMRDNMYTFWTATETILNKIYVKRTNVPFIYTSSKRKTGTHIGTEVELSANFVKGLNELVPGIVDPENGRISVWAIALRGQAAFNRAVKDNIDNDKGAVGTLNMNNYALKDQYDEADYFAHEEHPINPSRFTKWFLNIALDSVASEDMMSADTSSPLEANLSSFERIGDRFEQGVNNALSKAAGSIGGGFLSGALGAGGSGGGSAEWDDASYARQYSVATNLTSMTSTGQTVKVNVDSREAGDNPDLVQDQVHRDHIKDGSYNRFGEYLTASLTAGAAFLILNVESTGSVGESFSNSADTNPIETLFNAVSSKIRSTLNAVSSAFELPFIGPSVKAAIDITGQAIDSASAGLASPLLALMYSATVSLPKSWSQSSASLPRASYKIKLTSPYGNSYSQLFNMYLPLSAILAASLPRSTGLDTHTAPFMLQLFDRGRVNIPYGMVESLSVTRGTSNLAFTRSGHPNAIDIDLNILDLNQIIAIDIEGGGLLTRTFKFSPPNFTDTSLDVYVSTITGQDVYGMFYRIPKYRLKLAEKTATFKALFTDSAAHAGFTSRWVPFLETITEVIGGNRAVEFQARD